MTVLEIICPFCMSYDQVKTELKIEYEQTQDEIYFDCDVCGHKGCLRREPRKPSLFVRVIQAIKKSWS